MKIGIISVNNAHNFGTTMQALGIKNYLESQGHQVQIVNYRNKDIEKSYRPGRILPGNTKKSKYKYFKKWVKEAVNKPYLPLRRHRFEKFFNEYFNLTKPCATVKDLRNAKFDFDVVFAGSDQIWNSTITKGLDPAFFGDFVGKNTIVASYGASIGNTSVPERELPVFAEHFKRMDYISVREEKAKEFFENVTDKPISVVCDPTFLPDRTFFKGLASTKSPYGNKKYIYVHVHHYSAKAVELVAAAKELSEKTGLPIVHNIQSAKFKNQLGRTVGAGPIETLNAIAHAECILTQSFHLSVFSLIFEKNFITIKRDRNNDRLDNLFAKLGLSNHFIEPNTPLPDLNDLAVNFKEVHEKMDAMRPNSVEFINTVLNGKKCDRIPDYFTSGDKFTCYGCSACKDACPTQAITMERDTEGFYQPLINADLCINCGKCNRVCPYNTKAVNNEMESVGYMAYAKNTFDSKQSASGGMFPILAKNIFSKGGYVIGVKYNDSLIPVYDIATTLNEAKAFRGSKYVEARHNNIYKKTKKALDTGKPVLFTGAPCKIAGLKNYLGREYENLITAEIICACSSSSRIFKRYLNAKTAEKDSPVTKIAFRDKSKGWNNVATTLNFENGKEESTKRRWNIYYHCFVSAYLAKRSCFRCEFAGDNKIADITMGDFWGYDKINKKLKLDKTGVSVLKIATKKGMDLVNEVKDGLCLYKVSLDDIYNNNHSWPIKYTPEREEIFADFAASKGNTLKILKKYNSRYNKKK
jgi:coenzyme F420-reducing hydrogenase beta subunit